MKTIAIYKHTSKKGEEFKGKIQRIEVLPDDKSEEEIKVLVEKYNADNDDYVVSIEVLTDELYEVIYFLQNDRTSSVKSQLEALEDIKRDISDIDDYLYSNIREIKRTLKID